MNYYLTMPKVRKSLRDYLAKFKHQNPQFYLPSTSSLSSSKKWILRNCKHTKTLSFAVDNKSEGGGGGGGDSNKTNDDESATLSDIDRFLFENFKSLYLRDDEDDQNQKRVDEKKHDTPKQGPSVFDPPTPRFMNPPHDLSDPSMAPGLAVEGAGTNVIATSDEASSNLTSISSSPLIHDSLSNSPTPEDCITIFTYSSSPCEAFKRSMQELVESRLRNNEGIDWEFMEELLFCHLKHNGKKSYKYILNAFVDTVVALRQNRERVTPTKAAGQSTAGGTGETGSSVPDRKSAPDSSKNVREANQEFGNKA